jgi:N-acetylglutamate synthase-like GNAT family acetyltransferase
MIEAKPPKTFEYRKANGNDETDILSVLEEVAPEVPISLGESELDNMKVVIRTCCASGESWVAVDDNAIVGVVLAKPDFNERDFIRNRALSLPFIGVNKTFQKKGIFSNLLEKLKAKGVPLSATVLNTNKSSMAKHLEKIKFTKVESNDTEAKFKWTPDASQASTKA